MTRVVETFVSGIHLATPHGPEEYPGLQVVRPGEWDYAVIVPTDGQTFTALGGEWVPGYRLRRGITSAQRSGAPCTDSAQRSGAPFIEAQGFTLGPGDEVTRVRTDLPGFLAEWRVRRA